jgi:hypothetical protein
MGAWWKMIRRILPRRTCFTVRSTFSPRPLFAEVPPNELPSIHLPSFFGTSVFLGYTLLMPQSR